MPVSPGTLGRIEGVIGPEVEARLRDRGWDDGNVRISQNPLTDNIEIRVTASVVRHAGGSISGNELRLLGGQPAGIGALLERTISGIVAEFRDIQAPMPPRFTGTGMAWPNPGFMVGSGISQPTQPMKTLEALKAIAKETEVPRKTALELLLDDDFDPVNY